MICTAKLFYVLLNWPFKPANSESTTTKGVATTGLDDFVTYAHTQSDGRTDRRMDMPIESLRWHYRSIDKRARKT